MDAADFPKVNRQEFNHSFFIRNNVLKRLIVRSTFASSTDDSRPVFQGCSVTIENNTISFVATNTHRLVVAKAEIEDNIPGENKFIVPAKTLNDLLSIINSAQEDNGVKVEFSDKHIAFTVNNIFITCRLIDGQFPPHEKVIPASCETFATVDIGEFRSAISRVEIISKQTEYNTVRLLFTSEGLELSSDSYEMGKVVEHVNSVVEGPDVEIAFNLKYVQDFLKIVGGNDEVRIGMNDKLSPADFRLTDDEDFIYIVTPVRT
jgi:DNA polymerase-3 subunit beta